MGIFRWLALASLGFVAACDGCSNRGDNADASPFVDAKSCNDGCGAQVCRYDICIDPPAACTVSADCKSDAYCDPNNECIPFGVGPGGDRDTACLRDAVPGVFTPGAQCEWLGPPPGDPYPNHKNVLGNPVVGYIGGASEFAAPAIIFISYNNDDGGAQAAQGTDPLYFGVIRIIDGADCHQIASLATPTVVASQVLALADIGGADELPEIIATRTDGGLVAFTGELGNWRVLWTSADQYHDTMNQWAGASVHDLNDDGVPEILNNGAVYSAAGVLQNTPPDVSGRSTGYFPVVGDVDGDGSVELVAGANLWTWDTATTEWVVKQTLTGGINGHTAIADMGTYPLDPAGDNRGVRDGIAEIVTVTAVGGAGTVHVFNLHGREIMTAPVPRPIIDGTPRSSTGGPPTVGDFDGDGKAEFATAGAVDFAVYDIDCVAGATPADCPTQTTNQILWTKPSQDGSSNTTGSSLFDFDGDGRAEAVYGDECFTRVYDGQSGDVLYSRYRRSCTWYENPVIADVDNDFNAEIVSTSNTNCSNITCPAVDPIYDGIRCQDPSDCPVATQCLKENPSDTLGFCRCQDTADCGGDGFVCTDRITPSAVGKVCRASNPGVGSAFGVRVLADNIDRWVSTRPIWNQHAYSVTNVDDRGRVPRTSDWVRNFALGGLNTFRQNSQGTGLPVGAVPDLTVRRTKVVCNPPGNPTVVAEICNRGTEPVARGLGFAVFANGETMARCAGTTTQILQPAGCMSVQCEWTGALGPGTVSVDVGGTADRGANTECREDNNSAPVDVTCP